MTTRLPIQATPWAAQELRRLAVVYPAFERLLELVALGLAEEAGRGIVTPKDIQEARLVIGEFTGKRER